MEGQGCSVSGALGVLLRVSRVVGLAPVTFVRERDGWRVIRSRALRIYGNILVTIIIILSIGITILDSMSNPEASVDISTTGEGCVWTVYRCFMVLVCANSVYGSWDQMGIMMACLNTVQKINQGLPMNFQSSSSERIKTILIVSRIAVSLALHSIDVFQLTAGPLHNIFSSYWLRVMYVFCDLLTGFLILQILQIHLLVHNISKTFVIINDSMRNMLQVLSESVSKNNPNIPPFDNGRITRSSQQTTSQNNMVGETVVKCLSGSARPTKSHHEIVHDLVQAYSKNCEVIRDMQQFYGKIFILLLGYFLPQLTLSSYLYIRKLYQNIANVTFSFINLAVQSSWCIYHLANLILLIEPCHLTHAEMLVTRGLVSQLMLYTRSTHEPLAVELDTFYRLLMLNQTKYSPLKITTLSRSLVITIMSSITTYLVILVQNM